MSSAKLELVRIHVVG